MHLSRKRCICPASPFRPRVVSCNFFLPSLSLSLCQSQSDLKQKTELRRVNEDIRAVSRFQIFEFSFNVNNRLRSGVSQSTNGQSVLLGCVFASNHFLDVKELMERREIIVSMLCLYHGQEHLFKLKRTCWSSGAGPVPWLGRMGGDSANSKTMLHHCHDTILRSRFSHRFYHHGPQQHLKPIQVCS